MKKSNLNNTVAQLGLGAVMLGSLLSSGLASAQGADFSSRTLDGGYMQVAAADMPEGKCGEGKCGDMKKDGKMEEGKCGEGKCGDMKKDGKMEEGKCGDMKKDGKMEEGKCGEGKCGG